MNFLPTLLIASIVDVVISFERRISIGDSVDPKDYPSVVLVNLKNKWKPQKPAVCTGSLISRSVVLTAGHCTGEYEDFVFHSIDFMKRAKNEMRFIATGEIFTVLDSEEYFLERRYSFMEHVGLGYADIALFTLKDQLSICNRTAGQDFSIIKLPIVDVRSGNWTFIEDKIADCRLLGYGAHKEGSPDGQLRTINLTPRDHGNVLYAPLLTDGIQARACCGDSGGPMICHVGNRGLHIIGLTSFSFSPILERYNVVRRIR
uniref:Peptidase S1 domain-containing protein n=1 Tax=Parascaris univalens TaxID=6257 RepID=A0A915BUS2_PARUN